MVPSRIGVRATLLVGAVMLLVACNGGTQTTGVTAIAAGGAHTCAASWDGTMRCWGLNQFGQLGNGTLNSSNVPVEVTGLGTGPVARPRLLDIAAGGDHACAIVSGGKIFCWGSNYYGQLGLDSKTDYNIMQPVREIAGADGSTALGTFVVAGENHTCAVYSPGLVACWGRNYSLRPAWIRVSGPSSNALSVNAVAAGGNQTCVIEPGGTVKCWVGIAGNYTQPTLIQGITAKAIAVGRSHACAIDQSDTIKCWGSNVQGQLGNGTRTPTSGLVAVNRTGAFVPAVALAAGDSHTCAVFSSGAVECWGSNANYQTGDPSTTTSFTLRPFQVISAGASAVAAGAVHSCARIDDGSVRRMECWGWNASGQLGNGSTSQYSVTPVRVTGLP